MVVHVAPLHQCIVRHYSAVLRVKAGGHVNVQVSIVTQVMGASPPNCMSDASSDRYLGPCVVCVA
jgi:hypothetical protein